MTVAALAPPAGAPLARIASIRARFEPGATAPGADATSFADALSAALGTTGAAPTADAGAATGEQVVQLAMEYQGIPYRWGGTDPATGLDCSGFVQHVFRRVGIELPRVSAQQARAGTAVPSLDQARPGDLVAFGDPVDHIGIYLGDGKMIHAPHSGDVVKVSDIGNRPVTAIRRVTGGGTDPIAGATTGWSPTVAGGTVGTFPDAGPSALPAAIVPKVRQYEALFVQAGRRWDIDPSILAAQCQRESGGNVDAVSSAGAQGLMQFMPSTARARGVNPWDPASAIDGAARYLSEMRDQFGSMELAIAAYAAGPGAVRRAGNQPPNQQTRDYVTKLLALAGGPR